MRNPLLSVWCLYAEDRLQVFNGQRKGQVDPLDPEAHGLDAAQEDALWNQPRDGGLHRAGREPKLPAERGPSRAGREQLHAAREPVAGWRLADLTHRFAPMLTLSPTPTPKQTPKPTPTSAPL